MAAKCFLKLFGVPGESTVPGHQGQIEIASWSWGEAMPGSVPTFPTKSDFNFQGTLDAAAPKLMLALAQGTQVGPAVLTCLRTDSTGKTTQYLKITLQNVFISSYELTGDGSSGLGEDSFSLNFTKIDFQYTTHAGVLIETSFDFTPSGG